MFVRVVVVHGTGRGWVQWSQSSPFKDFLNVNTSQFPLTGRQLGGLTLDVATLAWQQGESRPSDDCEWNFNSRNIWARRFKSRPLHITNCCECPTTGSLQGRGG